MYCQKPLGMTVAGVPGDPRRRAPTRSRVPDRHAAAVRPQFPLCLRTGPQRLSGQDPHRRSGGSRPDVQADVPASRPRPSPCPRVSISTCSWARPKCRPYNGGLWAWPDWYLIRDYCVGFIVNWGVHHLDIANWGCPAVTSEPCELEFTGSYRNDGLTDNINDWTGEFRYESGLRMTYSDTGNPNQQGCTFRGDEGWVHVNRSRIYVRARIAAEASRLKPDDIDLDAGASRQPLQQLHPVRAQPQGSDRAGRGRPSGKLSRHDRRDLDQVGPQAQVGPEDGDVPGR